MKEAELEGAEEGGIERKTAMERAEGGDGVWSSMWQF